MLIADNGDEQVALIGGPIHLDYEDPDEVALVFGVYISEAVASTQRLDRDEMRQLLLAAQARDLKELRGYPVWIKREGNRMIYLRPWSRKP